MDVPDARGGGAAETLFPIAPPTNDAHESLDGGAPRRVDVIDDWRDEHQLYFRHDPAASSPSPSTASEHVMQGRLPAMSAAPTAMMSEPDRTVVQQQQQQQQHNASDSPAEDQFADCDGQPLSQIVDDAGARLDGDTNLEASADALAGLSADAEQSIQAVAAEAAEATTTISGSSGSIAPPAPACADKCTITYDYEENAEGHQILRLRPTREQWEDFPVVLAQARGLGAEGDGCFKVMIPDGLHGPLPEKPAQQVAANAYKVKLVRRTAFWQVSTVPSQGVFTPSQPGEEFSDSVDVAFRNLKHLFRKNQNRQLRNIRYRVDVPAWTKTQRCLAGVPEQSPIYPLKGDQLDRTRAIIPGIHTPYVYESGPHFGASFQIHAEDFRLASLNHLYKGRKIWIVIPATAVDVAEAALGRGEGGCSQFMRHRAEFFFPDKLDKLGIPYRIVDQRPGETIVILPDAYHEGFSCGYTIAEAKNYADAAWTTDSYQPCLASCRLATAIPAALMRPLEQGEDRLDLCAAYGSESAQLLMPGTEAPSRKRDHETMTEGCMGMQSVEDQRIKV